MLKLAIAFFVAAIGFTSPTISFADTNQRAYAPENIWQLSVNDQIRVIENEYRDQSNGRQIPDDQLDFYLDQIKYSRWTFSKISSDISTSLRGNNNNWRPPTGGGWNATSVICSSNDKRYQECRTPFYGRARIVENISKTRCVEGQNWGSRQGIVWVNNGCRGRFIDSGNGWGNNNQVLRCESINGRYQECPKKYNDAVYLSRRLSNSSCVEGASWGQKSNYIWVTNGCRAEFKFRNNYTNNSGYAVTCTSYNNQFKTCAWDRNRGTPRLIERISGRCNERYDWGYDNNRGLWVANSCSARFGIR